MRILHPEVLIFFAVLLFSLIFRVTNLDLIEFKTDEAVNLILASKLTPGGTVSSIGILNPPLFTYIISPLTFVSLDPKIFSLFIALLNSLAITFFYLIVKKYYGQIIAFASSTLFAFSPWAILYSRKIWTQDILIPIFIILFFSFHQILEKRKIFWIPFALSALFIIQLHQISILFVALVFIFMLLRRIEVDLKYLIIGIVLGVIPLIPYLSYEAKNSFPDIKAIFKSEQRLATKRSPNLFLRPLQITGASNFNFILGNDHLTFVNRFPLTDKLRRIFYLEYLLIPFGAFLFLKKFTTYKALALASVTLPFLYFLLKIETFMHYYIIILPILFLLLGVSFDFLFKQKRLVKVLSLILFLSLIIASASFNLSFFQILKDQGGLQGDYGESLRNSEKRIGNKNYNEAFLFKFVPLNYSFGYNPFAKMVYSDTLSSDIPKLEEKLKNSNDPKIEQKLLAYYTKTPPSLKTLDVLRKKAKDIPQYSEIYKTALEDYMGRNYKKQYISNKLDIMFFYPEHWKVTEADQIVMEADNLTLVFQKNENPPYRSMVIRKGKDEKGFENDTKAANEVLESVRFLSD